MYVALLSGTDIIFGEAPTCKLSWHPAEIAQLVEQWTVMQQVLGSIPTPNSTWLGVDSALHPFVGR